MVLGSLAEIDAAGPSARQGIRPRSGRGPPPRTTTELPDVCVPHQPRPSPPARDAPRAEPGDATGAPPDEGTDPTADRMLAAARQGSNRAWAALIERVDPTCRLLAHLVLGGNDVDATLQSAYVRAYRARRKGSDDAVVLLLNHVWITCGHEIRRRQRREAPAPGRRPQRDPRPSRLGPPPMPAPWPACGPRSAPSGPSSTGPSCPSRRWPPPWGWASG